MIIVEIIIFLVGILLVLWTGISAIQTFILPRGRNVFLLRLVFKIVWLGFALPIRFSRTYEQRDRVMALYAPLTLVTLPIVWIALVLLGYMLMFWAAGIRPLANAFWLSGSSLFTLGFAPAETPFLQFLAFSEAAIGLGLVALLIAYLPTMYNAFSRREEAVNLLEVRAGSPPTAVEWLSRAQRNDWLPRMGEQFQAWEQWFANLEESHTSLTPLVFFRSPQPDRSWVTASGAVLDTAALMAALVDVPAQEMNAHLCLRAGYLALRRIADLFDIEYDPDPHFPGTPISIAQEEFHVACEALATAKVPLKEDRRQAWLDFAGWRVNYDAPLVALAALTKAPYAPWSSDRSLRHIKTPSPR